MPDIQVEDNYTLPLLLPSCSADRALFPMEGGAFFFVSWLLQRYGSWQGLWGFLQTYASRFYEIGKARGRLSLHWMGWMLGLGPRACLGIRGVFRSARRLTSGFFTTSWREVRASMFPVEPVAMGPLEPNSVNSTSAVVGAPAAASCSSANATDSGRGSEEFEVVSPTLSQA